MPLAMSIVYCAPIANLYSGACGAGPPEAEGGGPQLRPGDGGCWTDGCWAGGCWAGDCCAKPCCCTGQGPGCAGAWPGPGAGPAAGPHDRKSVGWGKSVSVRVALGGRRLIQTKTHNNDVNTHNYTK